MIPDSKPLPYLYARRENFLNGVDSSKAPDLIAEGFSAFAINVTFRGGKPTNRPAYREMVIPDQEHKFAFQQQKAQGEYVYQDLSDDTAHLIAIRGGDIFRIELDTLAITLLNPSDKNEKTRRHYFCQADKYLVIQNGVDFPFIYDGISLRRSFCRENNPGIDNISIVPAGDSPTGTATITTSTPHGFSEGDYAAIDGNVAPSGYIGNYTVTGVLSDTEYTIRYALPAGQSVDPASPAGKTYHPMEVPKGLFMEYALGRLCVVSVDRKTMHIGDIIRTTPDSADIESVLWFTEELYLAESFVFSLPASQGRIRSVGAIPFMGWPTGQGDLLISGDKGLSTLSLAYQRTEWLTKPLQKIAMTGVAIASQVGQVGYNGDMIFRDLEFGIRTFRLTNAEYSKGPGQTPMSAEMNRVFFADDKDKLQFSSMVVFDNRLLATVTPVYEQRRVSVTSIAKAGGTSTINYSEPAAHVIGNVIRLEGTTYTEGGLYTVTAVNSTTSVDIATADGSSQGVGGFISSEKTGAEYYHRGLAVLDYTSISGSGGVSQPAWDGLWTGLNIQGLHKAFLAGAPLCVATVYNDNLHRNELWQITNRQGEDIAEFSSSKQPCSLELAAMNCEKSYSEKKLLALNLFLNDIRGNLVGNIFYRNDGDHCWRTWLQSNTATKQFELCAEVDTNPELETSPFSDGLAQHPPQRRLVKLGQPLFACESQTTADARLFYETQLKIEWTGLMTIDKMELMVLEQIQDMRGGCR